MKFVWLLGLAMILGAGALPVTADTSETAAALPARGYVWTPEPGDVIAFDVLRNGSEFGTHIVRCEPTGQGEFAMVSDVDLRAGFGPLTLFRYQLDTREVWRDGYLVSLSGTTKDDGTRKTVSAERDGDVLRIDGSAFQGAVPAGIIPSSHWNVREARAERMLSTESGKLIDMQVRSLGRETLSVNGQEISARKYFLDADIDVTLWYDETGRWVKLAFSARGQDIEYVLRELY